MKIVLDTQGGDNPSEEIIKGGIEFGRETGTEVVFVGDRETIRETLICHHHHLAKSSIIHAPEVITMQDAPIEAIRNKKNSSLVAGIKAVKDGLADAFVSPANTGAVMAASFFLLGRIQNIERPGIIIALPTINQKKVLVIDVGANADCLPENLLQFALMGQVYAQILGNPNPSIGLLNIGQEPGKGNRLTLDAYLLLRDLPNFYGNIESNKILLGEVDAVVCDGFSGNLILKAYPSGAAFAFNILKQEMAKNPRVKLAAWLAKPAFKKLKKLISPTQYGGAPLLGIRGIVVIAHGHSDAEAIKNALLVAQDAVGHQLIKKLENGLK